MGREGWECFRDYLKVFGKAGWKKNNGKNQFPLSKSSIFFKTALAYQSYFGFLAFSGPAK